MFVIIEIRACVIAVFFVTIATQKKTRASLCVVIAVSFKREMIDRHFDLSRFGLGRIIY